MPQDKLQEAGWDEGPNRIDLAEIRLVLRLLEGTASRAAALGLAGKHAECVAMCDWLRHMTDCEHCFLSYWTEF